jgi:hypothetical protein
MDVSPNEFLTLSASAGFGKDDFPDSYFGLEQTSFQTFSVGADYKQPDGWGVGASYNYEHYSGDQRSRTAKPRADAAAGNRSKTGLDGELEGTRQLLLDLRGAAQDWSQH